MKNGQGKRMLFGLVVVFALFQLLGDLLGSDRGQAGIIIGLIVAAATVIADALLFGRSIRVSTRVIGIGWPFARGVSLAIAIGAALLAAIPFFASVMNVSFEFYPGWQWLALGIFFQAGIGEETLFRGYLFGHMRQRHTFWKAAAFAAVPFVVVHLILFYSLPWTIGIASILLAVAMSFPLSRLFEMGDDTIWAPAIIHFVSQAGVKLLVPSGEDSWLFPFFWIAACAVLPLGVYAFPLVAKAKKWLVAAPAAGLVLLVCAHSAAGQAADPSTAADLFNRSELTRDWEGRRQRLKEQGLELKLRLTQVYQAAKGDRAYSGKLDTQFKLDLEKLAGWKMLSVQMKTETRFGRVPTTGAALPVNSATLTPTSRGASFAVTAFNITQLIPLDEKKGGYIAVSAGKYYSLDTSREPFTGGAGITRFMGIAANGNPAVGQTVPVVSNGATFAWIRKGSPFVTFAVFDPVGSPTKIGVRRLFRQGVTLAPGISIPTRFAGRSGRHSFSGTITMRKFTPFDQLAQFVQPGQPRTPGVPRSGSWSATYTFNQYISERTIDGEKTGWGVFGVFTLADSTTNPVAKFSTFGIGGNGLFKSRQRDQFGVAYALAGVSRKLKTVIDPLIKVGDEQTFETFYNFDLTPWLSLTGDLQIIRPALRSENLKIITGVRMVVNF